MPLFVTFEGGEGCGKSLQARALYQWLTRLAIPAILTHEPGGTPLGERISRLLKWERQELSPLTELLLFNASRAELVKSVVQPGLRDGKVVICDRYADSTVAYQGYGRGLDLDIVSRVNNVATRGLNPDLTVLLDMPAEEGLARKNSLKADRFQQENLEFHRRVRDGYLKLAAAEPERWLIVDARQSRGRIACIVREKVGSLLARRP